MEKSVIGITMGDPAGIGSEIIIKALENKNLTSKARLIVIGSAAVMRDAIRITSSNLEINIIDKISDLDDSYSDDRSQKINLLDLDNIELEDFEYGQINQKAGVAGLEYVKKAIDLAQKNIIQGVVTAPLSKEAINKSVTGFSGHTGLFAQKTGTKNYTMMLVEGDLRVVHVSTHVSLKEACTRVKKERVFNVIKLAAETMKQLGFKEPSIGVAGLNPHAGEGGMFGSEEEDEIIPAINRAKKAGIKVQGPIPPDTIFSRALGGEFDIVVAMYHDQGHIPVKTTGFQYDNEKDEWSNVNGVNVTLGLPVVRTSVDHGVAFDRAGQGTANPNSMISAINMAYKLIKNK